jgi:hypothetical protein
MSDNYLRYVPSNPHFQPTQDGAVAATALLRSLLPQAQAVTSTFYENIEFVDAGGNWSGVHCPTCGTDAEAWWDDAMSEAAETQFSSLLVQARCCGATVSLNELRLTGSHLAGLRPSAVCFAPVDQATDGPREGLNPPR